MEKLKLVHALSWSTYLVDEVLERSLADETDPGTVAPLGHVVQAVFCGYAANVTLQQVTHGK